MRKIIYVSISILIIVGCQKKNIEQNYILTGEIKGQSPDTIYLKYGNKKKKSAVIDNKFFFKGYVENPKVAELTINPASNIDKEFYVEKGKIKLYINIEKKKYKNFDINFIKLNAIEGSKTSKILSEFENYKKINEKGLNWKNNLFTKLNQIIVENPSNEVSGDLLLEVLKDSILPVENLNELFTKLDTSNQSKYTITSLREGIFSNETIKIGKQILDFSLPNKEQKIVSTKDYRNSILFIDFWASWCKPCRAQNPKLIEIYNKYKNNNFEILGVSIDTNKNKWLKALTKDKLPWQNIIDTSGIESEILINYKAATSIPRNYLIDKNGIIKGIDMELESLEKYLEN